MGTKVQRQGKLREAARVFYLSWVPTERGADKAGPRNTASALLARLRAVDWDQQGRTVKQVIDSAPGEQVAGARLTIGGDSDLTDFVALMTAEYASVNKVAPAGGGTGELAQAMQEVIDAGEAESELAIWTAVIDATSEGQRSLWTIAGRRFGEVRCCHALTSKPSLRTSPSKALEKDVSDAVDHLLGVSTCPLCAPKGPIPPTGG